MHDPKHVILRRALRVALLVSLTFFVTQYVFRWDGGALSAAFACFSMLAFADFGGPRRNRLTANLLLGLIGVVLVTAGSLISDYMWPAVIVTFIVVFVVAFSAVLRGYFAAATAAAILPWAYAVTAPYIPAAIPGRSLGWAVGALVAAFGSVLVWPSFLRSDLRTSLAEYLDSAATAIKRMDSPAEFAAAADEMKQRTVGLHAAYDGRLVRPGGVTKRDRAMLLAIDETSRLSMTLTWTDIDAAQLGPIDKQLMAATASALDDCSKALRDGSVIPDPAALDRARDEAANDIHQWCEERFAEGRADSIRVGVEASAHVRLACLSAEAMATYVRGAMDPQRQLRKEVKSSNDLSLNEITFSGKPLMEQQARITAGTLLADQLTFKSPWLRTALRTAFAITATVLLVFLLGAEHGFWLSLGALVALKFDASGTTRTASQVVIGTIAGFIIGLGLLYITVDKSLLLWLLLPVIAFLAAYTPGAISLIVGQASFTVFVIDLVGLTTPDRLAVAEWRLTDVILGVSVSLVVSLLMWPHGVVPIVVRTARQAVRTGTAYFLASYEELADGPNWDEHVRILGRRALATSTRADETFDLAFSQRGPGLTDTSVIIATLNTATQLNHAAEVVSALAHIESLPDTVAATGDALMATAHRAGMRVVAAVEALDPDRDAGGPAHDMHHSSLARLRTTVDSDLLTLQATQCDSPEGRANAATTAMVATFGIVWIAQAVWMADKLWQLVAEREKAVS